MLIDFTRPEATLATLDACVRGGKGMVIGTTGFAAEQQARIDAAARTIPICKAGNFSIGVNLCLKLLEQAAAALGDGLRHRDRGGASPAQGRCPERHRADDGRGRRAGRRARPGIGGGLRAQGHTGARPATIGFSTIRGGDVVGDHTACSSATASGSRSRTGQSSRLNFATGALRAAAWLAGRPPGSTR